MTHTIRITKIVEACAVAGIAKAQALAMQGRDISMRLYYSDCGPGKDGTLILVQDDEQEPAGFKLATGKALRGDIEYPRYQAWIAEQAKTLPLLGWPV